MTTITYDTLKFVRRLKEAGIPESQAEAISEAFKEAQATQLDSLAAKRDVKELEGQISTKADGAKVDIHVLELKRDIKELEVKLDAKIETAKVETIKWVVATGIIILGGVATINRLSPPPPVYSQPPAQELRLPAPSAQPGK